MRKKIYLVIILIISTSISILAWENISFQNSGNLISRGEYYLKNYNPNNEIFRFVFFIGFPLILFLTSFLYYYSKITYKFTELIKIEINNSSFKENKFLNLFFYIFLGVLTLDFFLLDFDNFTAPLDVFHEGDWLTASNNYLISGGAWTSSYVARGLFGSFYPLVLWEFFDVNSIGAARLTKIIILFFCKILLLILAKQISLNINFSKNGKILFFLFLSLIFISMVSYLEIEEFVMRSALFLLFLNIFFISLSSKNKLSLINIFIGLFSIISLLWFIDIGAYINIVIFFIIIFFLTRSEFRTVSSILLGIILGWILFYSIIPNNEFYEFISNTTNIYLTIDRIHGQIYPTPFISGDARSTRALLLFIFAGVFVIYINFKKNNEFSNLNRIFFIFLFLSSLLTFKTALSNSDSYHIKMASGPLLLIISTSLLYIFFKFFNENNIINRIKNLFKNDNLNIFYGFLLVIIVVLNFDILKIKSILSAPDKINSLVNYNNDTFLNSDISDYKNLLIYYNNLLSNEDCVQILTDEVALPFLLNKKSCTKYIQMFISTPEKIQNKFIEELKIKKPKIILLETDIVKFSVPVDKLKLVRKFVEDNYTFHSKFRHWTFVKLSSNN